MPVSSLRLILTVLVLTVMPAAVLADEKDADAFHWRIYESPRSGSLPYSLFVPRNLVPGKKYPVVLFLHGAGERGMDNKRQVRDIQAWTREEVQAKYPCFIVAPQCPNWKEVFQVYGGNTDLAVTTYRNYSGSEKQWKHYQIAAGKQYTGKMNWMFFFNDDWGKDTPIESTFRSVKIYEAGQAARVKTIDFRKTPLSPYAGGGRGNSPTVEDNGATIHIIGDTRKKIPLPYMVTKNTIIEFDFKSGAQGNIHGIGLDDDDQLMEYRWVQVDWGAPSHTLPREPSGPLRLVMEMLPGLQKEFSSMDPRRLYVAGVSMGGFGAWDLIARHPDWFAAAVPICGGADLETVNMVAPVPIWDFHGSQDGTVRPDRSRNMIAALWNVGAEPRYTEYPGVGHDAWTKAFQEPALLPWLFAQKSGMSPPPPPTNLKVTCDGALRVELTWAPPKDDEIDIKEYRVLRDGGEVGLTAEPRFLDTEIGEGDVHSYTVVAINRAWLRSKPTAQVWAKVPADTFPPRVDAVKAQGSPNRIEVHFNKLIEAKHATDSDNYTLDHGLTINAAVLLPDKKTVRLETAQLAPKIEYTLTVNHIVDLAAKPNTLANAVQMKFTYDPCLAGHWRLDEGEGSYSADATGNGSGSSGNVVTFHSVEWVPGKWGKALSFDGNNDHYAWTRQSQSLDLTDGLTVAFWVKKGVGQYTHQILIAKSNYFDHRTQFMIDLDPSQQVRATVGTMDKGDVTVTGKRIDARDWHHIALTYGNNTLELFIDGVSQGKAGGGDKLMSVSETITIGSGHQGRDPIKGALDEIRIYNRPLAAPDIKALATATSE